MVFTREDSDALTGLVKRLDAKLDETMAKLKRTQRLAVFVVHLGDEGAIFPKLKDQVAKLGLKQVVLSACPPHNPRRYRVAPEAGVTVAVYDREGRVTANIAARVGEFGKEKADAALDAVVRVLPK